MVLPSEDCILFSAEQKTGEPIAMELAAYVEPAFVSLLESRNDIKVS